MNDVNCTADCAVARNRNTKMPRTGAKPRHQLESKRKTVTRGTISASARPGGKMEDGALQFVIRATDMLVDQLLLPVGA